MRRKVIFVQKEEGIKFIAGGEFSFRHGWQNSNSTHEAPTEFNQRTVEEELDHFDCFFSLFDAANKMIR